MQQAGNNNNIQYSITSQRSNDPCQHTYTHKHIQFMVHSNANYIVAKETMTGAAGRPPLPPTMPLDITTVYTHNYIICTRLELCGNFVVVAIPVNVLIHGNKTSYRQAFQWNDGSIKSPALCGGREATYTGGQIPWNDYNNSWMYVHVRMCISIMWLVRLPESREFLDTHQILLGFLVLLSTEVMLVG